MPISMPKVRSAARLFGQNILQFGAQFSPAPFRRLIPRMPAIVSTNEMSSSNACGG